MWKLIRTPQIFYYVNFVTFLFIDNRTRFFDPITDRIIDPFLQSPVLSCTENRRWPSSILKVLMTLDRPCHQLGICLQSQRSTDQTKGCQTQTQRYAVRSASWCSTLQYRQALLSTSALIMAPVAVLNLDVSALNILSRCFKSRLG